MPSDIIFEGGESIKSYGKGRPNPSEFTSTVNEILESPTYSSAEQKGKLQTVINSYNQKVTEIERLRNTRYEIGRNTKLHELTKQAKQDIKYLGVLNDYESTYNYWARDLNNFLKGEFGGRVPPDIQAYVLNVKNQIEDKQLRILWDDTQKEAFNSLSSMSSTVRQNLFNGEVTDAARNYHQLLGVLNSYEEHGIFDKRLSQNLKQGYARSFNDESASSIMQKVQLIGVTHGFTRQKEYYEKVKGLVNLDQASPNVATAFTKLGKNFDQGEIDFSNRVLKLDRLLDANVKTGIGNAISIRDESRSVLSMIDKKSKELHPLSKEYKGLQSFKAEIKAFDKITSGFMDTVSRGSASPFSKLMTPMGKKGYENLFKDFNIDDIQEKVSLMTQHNTIVNRYEFKKDPLGAMNSLSKDYKSNTSKGSVSSPNFISQLNDEYDNINFLRGRGGISEATKKTIGDILSAVPQSPEDASLQQSIVEWFDGKGISMSHLMQDSKHPVIGSTGLHLIQRNQSAFDYLDPSQNSWTEIRSNYDKQPGYKGSVRQLKDYYLENFTDELEEIARAQKTDVDSIANMMSLNIVQGLMRGSNGGPLGMRGVGSLSRGVPEDLEDQVEDHFESMRGRLLEGYKIRDKGNTSLLNKGFFSRTLDTGSKLANNFLELFTGEVEPIESERGTGFTLPDTDPLDQIELDRKRIQEVGRERKNIRAERVKLYKKLSDVTGLSQADFTNRISINQSDADGNYYLMLNTGTDNYAFISYKEDFPFKGRLSISEEEMEELLGKDLSLGQLTDAVIDSILRTP